jgi:hypothetical protein
VEFAERHDDPIRLFWDKRNLSAQPASMVLLGPADTVIGILKFKKYVFSRNSAFATGSSQDASANIGSVAIEAFALAARFLSQVASLASRHGQFTVRAAFFCLFDGHFGRKLHRSHCNPVTEPGGVPRISATLSF